MRLINFFHDNDRGFKYVNVKQRLKGPSTRNLVWRCRIILPNAGEATSVIVKKIGDKEMLRADAHLRYQSELRAHRHISACTSSQGLCPKLHLGLDRHHVLVFEDLGKQDKRSRRWDFQSLICASDVLGRLSNVHVPVDSTNGYFARDILSPFALETAFHAAGVRNVRRFISSMLEVVVSDNTRRSLCHGDLVRSNLHLRAGQAALIDFEFSEIAPFMRDLASFYMAMPTAEYPERIPTHLLLEMRYVFLQALRKSYSINAFNRALFPSCCFWMLLTLSTHLMSVSIDDCSWGGVSNRSRIVTRLGLLEQLAEQQKMHDIARGARNISIALFSQWEDAALLPFAN